MSARFLVLGFGFWILDGYRMLTRSRRECSVEEIELRGRGLYADEE